MSSSRPSIAIPRRTSSPWSNTCSACCPRARTTTSASEALRARCLVPRQRPELRGATGMTYNPAPQATASRLRCELPAVRAWCPAARSFDPTARSPTRADQRGAQPSARQRHERAPVEAVGPYAMGARGLLRVGFGRATDPGYPDACNAFLDRYDERVCVESGSSRGWPKRAGSRGSGASPGESSSSVVALHAHRRRLARAGVHVARFHAAPRRIPIRSTRLRSSSSSRRRNASDVGDDLRDVRRQRAPRACGRSRSNGAITARHRRPATGTRTP